MSLTVAIDARSIGERHTGDTVYWTGLVRALMARDSDLRFLLISNAPKPDSIPESSKIQWIVAPSRRQRWWSLFRFPLVARRHGASVIHTQYNLSPLVSRGGVTTIHDVSFFHDPSWFRPQDRLLLQRFVPPSARRAARIVTVSEFSKREIERTIPGTEGKIAVAHNACPDAIAPFDRAESQTRIREELEIEGPYLLTVGTRWPRKNAALAIAAAQALPDSAPHRLVVTGKPGWGEETAGSRTMFTGFVSDEQLCALYSAADLYVAPALYEGFGITLLEAMRCQCPVLASDIEPHREVGGIGVEYAPSMEASDWSAGIQRLLSDEPRRESLISAGRVQEAKFSWAKSAEIHERVYREACGQPEG